VDVVLVVGFDAVEHQVRPEAAHLHRRGASLHEPAVQLGQRRGRGDEQRLDFLDAPKGFAGKRLMVVVDEVRERFCVR